MTSELDAYLESNRDRRLASYFEFLRIPSISAQPEYGEACRQAAEWLAGQLHGMGIDNVEVSETGGHPIVYGDWLHAADAPTVIVYGHYDVQPVDPIELWETAPFEPFLKGDRVVGRGPPTTRARSISTSARPRRSWPRGVPCSLLFKGGLNITLSVFMMAAVTTIVLQAATGWINHARGAQWDRPADNSAL